MWTISTKSFFSYKCYIYWYIDNVLKIAVEYIIEKAFFYTLFLFIICKHFLTRIKVWLTKCVKANNFHLLCSHDYTC